MAYNISTTTKNPKYVDSLKFLLNALIKIRCFYTICRNVGMFHFLVGGDLLPNQR